jgi:ABC-2 type transport system permease protein
MTEKEIKARYKRAVFGFLWVILNPLLQMIIIGAIFSFFIKIPNYFLFLFIGLLPWQFFSMSLSKATPSIVNERTLLQKAKFPIEAIPVSIILSNFLNLIISFLLFLPVILFLSGFTLKLLFIVIPVLLWLLIFTIGISLLAASLNVKWRDINFFVQTILLLWFYATPVLYNLKLIPPKLYFIFALNPLTSIIEILHYSFLGQGVIDPVILSVNIVVSLFVIIIGIFVFNKEKRFFVDWL